MTTLPDPSSLPAPRRQGPSFYGWLTVVLGLFVVLLGLYRMVGSQSALNSSSPTGLRKLSVVPAFALSERNGKTITNSDLSGKIWIASFVYTTCPGPCPIITANMAKLQKTLANDPQVMLVSFTVDPVTDTPPVLAKYADDYHADPNRWWFLTGTEKQMYDLIYNGFHLEMQDNSGQPPQEGQYKVTHSTNLALVDGDGNVRGYYNGVDDQGRPDLLRDIQVLENEAAK